MNNFEQYINCPNCMSENIELFTSGWFCHNCGYEWSVWDSSIDQQNFGFIK